MGHIEATIKVAGLRKRFGPAVALDGLSFMVGPGRVTGFVGPNGAGKSTTMPRRVTVLAAKAAILTGLVLTAGTIAVLASVLAGRLAAPMNMLTTIAARVSTSQGPARQSASARYQNAQLPG
jgi:ABC-type Na+ transport system ATPase subunit NatA